MYRVCDEAQNKLPTRLQPRGHWLNLLDTEDAFYLPQTDAIKKGSSERTAGGQTMKPMSLLLLFTQIVDNHNPFAFISRCRCMLSTLQRTEGDTRLSRLLSSCVLLPSYPRS